MQFNNVQSERVLADAGRSCKHFGIVIDKPPRDRRLERAAAAALRARGIPLTARRVRALLNAARTLMERRERGTYEAISLAVMYIIPGRRLPRWLR